MEDPFLKPNASLNRLMREYHQYGSLVIAYDFDGTVHDYHNKGETYHGVIKLLQNLKSIDCEMTCFTAREDVDYVKQYLSEHDIPCDRINENPAFFTCNARKIYYNAYLDDRAGLMQVYYELWALVREVVTERIRAKPGGLIGRVLPLPLLEIDRELNGGLDEPGGGQKTSNRFLVRPQQPQ